MLVLHVCRDFNQLLVDQKPLIDVWFPEGSLHPCHHGRVARDLIEKSRLNPQLHVATNSDGILNAIGEAIELGEVRKEKVEIRIHLESSSWPQTATFNANGLLENWIPGFFSSGEWPKETQ